MAWGKREYQPHLVGKWPVVEEQGEWVEQQIYGGRVGVDQGTAARSAKDNPTNGSDKLKYSRSIRSYGEEFHTENIHKVLNKAIERTIMKKLKKLYQKYQKRNQ